MRPRNLHVFLLAFALLVPIATAAQVTPATSAAPQVGGAVTQDLPGGTPISVSLGESLSSANATVGETVPIVSVSEVDINGYIVIPKGAEGQATVTTADRAGGNGHGGKLAINLDWIRSADGGKIALSSTDHATENGDQKGAASTATIATYLLLGPLGLFAHNFVRGKDVTLGTDKVYSVFVDHEVHVASVIKATAPDGFDH